MCLFRAVNNFLPTKKRLIQEHINVNAIYMMCNELNRGIDHLVSNGKYMALV